MQGHVRVLLLLLTIFASKKSPFLSRNFGAFSGGFGGHHCWDTLPSSCPMRCDGWWDGMLFGWRDGATILGGKAAVRLVFYTSKKVGAKKRRFSEASNIILKKRCVPIIRFEPGNGWVFLWPMGMWWSDGVWKWIAKLNLYPQCLEKINLYSDWIRWWFCPKKPLKHEGFRIAA